MSDTFCILPFLHINAYPDKKLKVCCYSQTFLENTNLENDSISDAFNSDEYKQIRLDMLNGEKPKVCDICFKNGHGMRNDFNNLWERITGKNYVELSQELVDEKVNLTGGTMSGNITFNGGQTFPNTVVLSGTNGSAVVPNGTTGQRDASPATGYFRYNTTLSQFEGYNGTAWGGVGGGADDDDDVDDAPGGTGAPPAKSKLFCGSETRMMSAMLPLLLLWMTSDVFTENTNFS